MNRLSIADKYPVWVFPALLFGVGVNVVLLLLLPLLSQIRSFDVDMTEPVAINLVRIREKEPPPQEEEEIEQAKKEEDPDIMDQLQPDLVEPKIQSMDMPTIQFQAKTELVSGPASPGLTMSFNADEVDHPPRALLKTEPLYPYKAKRLEIEGYVRVKFLVDKTGAVCRVAVLDSKPKGMFDDSVLTVLPSWKFAPGKILGEPVASWVTTTVEFELQ